MNHPINRAIRAYYEWRLRRVKHLARLASDDLHHAVETHDLIALKDAHLDLRDAEALERDLRFRLARIPQPT